jgi:2-iminobutanoate/2-iminopropanoate deaminase
MDDGRPIGNGLLPPCPVAPVLPANARNFGTGCPVRVLPATPAGGYRDAVPLISRRNPMQRLLAIAAFSLVLASASYAQTFEKKNFNYSKFAKGAFSEVVTVTGPAKMIYLAGIGSEDEDDGSVRHMDDFLQQCRFAWQKIGKLLQEHGATVSDIVKATTYVTDIRYRDEMRKCRTEVFAGKPLPPHTLLNVVQLARPGMMFEVDVVAAVAAK